jgi:hypothetical protein
MTDSVASSESCYNCKCLLVHPSGDSVTDISVTKYFLIFKEVCTNSMPHKVFHTSQLPSSTISVWCKCRLMRLEQNNTIWCTVLNFYTVIIFKHSLFKKHIKLKHCRVAMFACLSFEISKTVCIKFCIHGQQYKLQSKFH